jgi:Tol biopolymer transport system component
VKKHLALLLCGLVLLLVLAGQLARAAAGPEPNDVQDSLPAWSSSGVDLAFERTAAGQTSRVLEMSGSGRSIHLVGDGILRGWVPGTEHLLVQVDGEHTLVQTDSPQDRPLAEILGTDATASPDGQRVAYLRNGTLYVASVDGSGERLLASDVTPPSWDVLGPVWSPDGTRIVVASGSSLLLVQADGSGARTLFTGANQSVNPSWSRDGTLIAFERNAGPHWQIWAVHSTGDPSPTELFGGPGADYRYPQFSPTSDQLAFISDRQHVKGGATRYQFALYRSDLNDLVERQKLVDDVHPYSPPRWLPTGALIAVAAGQECQRWGIYTVRSEGSDVHRRSNVCRFDGTAAADTIHGSPYFDIVNGNGGNDRLYGLGGNDKISGEGGDDTILGGAGNDFILGGPGNDRIFGGPGNDVIIPGNGRDVVDCGPGDDTVEGAGPLDRIARNCEHVRR